MQPEKEAGTVEPYGAPCLLTCFAPKYHVLAFTGTFILFGGSFL